MRLSRYNMGGMMKYALNGTAVGDPTDPKKKQAASDSTSTAQPQDPNLLTTPTSNIFATPNYSRQSTIDVNYRNNEGMRQASTPGKIDAYNFDLPESGMLEDLDEATKEMLMETDFGKERLQGEGTLDEKYNRYAAEITSYIRENPDQALAAVNEMIDSGNKNFQGLAGMSDQEKVDTALRYMTDKKIGDFHGALSFGEKVMPTPRYYDPMDGNQGVSNIRGPQYPQVMRSLGDRGVDPLRLPEFSDAAEEAGVDMSKDSPEARKFITDWMDNEGYVDIRPGYRTDRANDAYLTRSKAALQETRNWQAARAKELGQQLQEEQQALVNRTNQAQQTAAQAAAERRRKAQEEIERQKAAMRGGANGLRISRFSDSGRVPTEEEKERGVTSVRRGLLGSTEKFGDTGSVKTYNAVGKFFTGKDQKARF